MNNYSCLTVGAWMIVLMLLNGCSTYGPTKEEIENANRNNLYGKIPSNYEKLIKEYLKSKQKLPSDLIEKMSISRPVNRYVTDRDTETTWWGVGSIVGISGVKLDEIGMHKSNISIKFKNGSKIVDKKTYIIRTSWYFIKGDKVLGNNPFTERDYNVSVNQKARFTSKHSTVPMSRKEKETVKYCYESYKGDPSDCMRKRGWVWGGRTWEKI